MGQHTKDILDGTCCQLCGQYFQDENGNLYSHGQQVVCKDCWQTLESAKQFYYTEADARVLSDSEEENVDLDFLSNIGVSLYVHDKEEYEIIPELSPEPLPEPFEITYNGETCKVRWLEKQTLFVFEVAGGSFVEVFFRDEDGRWTDIEFKSTKMTNDIGALIDQHLNNKSG